MENIQKFYLQVLKDDEAKKTFNEILNGKDLSEAGDDQLLQIGRIAERMGYNFTLAEVHSFLKSGDEKLNEEDLDAIAGGSKPPEYHIHFIRCEIGGDAEPSK